MAMKGRAEPKNHNPVYLQCFLPLTIFHNECVSGLYLEKY